MGRDRLSLRDGVTVSGLSTSVLLQETVKESSLTNRKHDIIRILHKVSFMKKDRRSTKEEVRSAFGQLPVATPALISAL